MTRILQIHLLPSWMKQLIMLGLDSALVPLALWVALALRYGEFYSDFSRSGILFAALPFFTIPIFIRLGFYRVVVRYAGRRAFEQIFTGVLISSGLLLAMMLLMGTAGLPRSLFAIYGIVAFALIGGSRALARQLLGYSRGEKQGNAVAIYGAGASGRQLVNMLRAAHEYRPVMFLDDKSELFGRDVDGLRVHDPSGCDLEALMSEKGVKHVLLAMPSAKRSARRKILQRLEPMPFHVFSVPSLEELLSGRASVDQLREVQIEDLLGRDAIPPNESLLGRCITGYSVMVTGAGGSIGSELCRQIISLRPASLVLYEQSEYALFRIESELQRLVRKRSLNIPVIALLGSVCDRVQLDLTIKRFAIETIYHAAAYKHVPIVERNPMIGIRNNVFGTYELASAARDAGVRHFVLISTDKAVRPTNVMGASKRLAEMVLKAMAADETQTCFSMVRFGNVLGSSGSVVPVFHRQIRQGGPVTVTHPEITRYFMTIGEAVQLVIQAGAMTLGGDVFVLDMGDPVKIYDLAKQMIHLSGLEVRNEKCPDGDIEIAFTGLRPGEKLYEELLIGENVSGTEHPKIMRAEEDYLPFREIQDLLDKLRLAVDNQDVSRVRALLLEAVIGYQTQADAEEPAWLTAANSPRLSAFTQPSRYRH